MVTGNTSSQAGNEFVHARTAAGADGWRSSSYTSDGMNILSNSWGRRPMWPDFHQVADGTGIGDDKEH